MTSSAPTTEQMTRTAEDPLERLHSAHHATPYKFTGGSQGGTTPRGMKVGGLTVDVLTWMNYLWTIRVQVLSSGESPVLLSYGYPTHGVPYDSVSRDGAGACTLVGKLGAGTGTRLEALSDSSALLKLTYVRYGATCSVLLAPVDDAIAQREARRLSSYGCCTRGCLACCANCAWPCRRAWR